VEAPSTIEILCPHVVRMPRRRSIDANLTFESQEASTEHVQLEDPVNIVAGYPEFHRNTLLSSVFRFVQGSKIRNLSPIFGRTNHLL